MADYGNPFAPTKNNVIDFTFPFQRVLEKQVPAILRVLNSIPKGNEPEYVSEGQPLATPTPKKATTSAAKAKALATAASKTSTARRTQQAAAKAATPASIAAIIKKPSSTIGGGAAGAGGAATPAPKAFGAQDLYADPTSMYDPVMAQIQAEKEAANARYAKNEASIKNIFGALSDLSAKDALRIQDQFKTSIASQQADLASRTAAANTGAAAGVAQAEATGAERGAGPEMALNPLQTATAEGIGRSNEYQTTWEALQNANASQAIIDASSRQTGYGQQQVGAIQQLQQNLEDKLLQLSGDTTAVQSDIAKAKYAAQQQVRETLYNEAQQKTANAAAAAAASSGGGGGGGGTTAKAKSYPKSIYGLESRMTDALRDKSAFNNLQASVNEAYALASRRKTSDPKNAGKNVSPSKIDVQRAWDSLGGQTQYATFAKDYINNYLGLK